MHHDVNMTDGDVVMVSITEYEQSRGGRRGQQRQTARGGEVTRRKARPEGPEERGPA